MGGWVRRMLSTVLASGLAIAGLYVALLTLMYVNQDRLIYFPMRELAATPAAVGLDYEDVWLTSADGLRLHGWYISVPNARGTVLYLHGNANNVGGTLSEAGTLAQLGLDTFSLDYRGYGQSEGTPSEAGLVADAVAAWRYLTDERGIPPERIIVMGHSLGGGVAAALAHQHEPAALVLMSTFTSMPDVAAERFPILPVRLLMHNDYPTYARLADIDAPILFSHARDDRTIPFAHSERLRAAANDERGLLELSGGHNRGIAVVYQRYPAELEAFLQAVLPQ